MRCDAGYKKLVVAKCCEALQLAGFNRYQKECVDWPLWDGFHGWVGLNVSLNIECVRINPFIGLHSVPIEKMWTGMKTGKYPGKYRRGVATYALHMGQIAPHEPVFEFTQHTDVDSEAARLARLYADVGMGYARSIASYEVLLPLLQERIAMLGAYPERVACCLYLMGRKEEARAFVQDFLKEHREYFEGFALPFLKKLVH